MDVKKKNDKVLLKCNNQTQRLIENLKKCLILENAWTDELENDIPKKWVTHGDLVLLPEHCFSSSVWTKLLGDKLWDIIADTLKKSRIAKQGRILRNSIREPSVALLKGCNGWVEHIDNKIHYRFNILTNMFSKGNISEKLRVARLNCENEIVVDMFAGIGYFTLPFLVHAGASFVHACDINPHAIEALKINLRINKVQDRCSVYEGDSSEMAPQNIADRVYLGLIPSSRVGWEAACRCLKSDSGGMLHIHENLTTKTSKICDNDAKDLNKKSLKINMRKKSGTLICDEIQQLLQNIHGKEWKVDLKHIEFVKQYAPHVDHVVLDILCIPKITSL